MFKAEVNLYSVNDEKLTVDMVHYVVSDTRMGSKVKLRLESLEVMDGLLKEGDVLIKRLRKNEE